MYIKVDSIVAYFLAKTLKLYINMYSDAHIIFLHYTAKIAILVLSNHDLTYSVLHVHTKDALLEDYKTTTGSNLALAIDW
jgi:hypothetical protein